MPLQFTSSAEANLAVWFHEAEQARLAGQVETAQRLLDRILAQAPAHAGAMHAHALVALTTNQFESAERWAERALEVQSDPACYSTLCVIQIKRRAYANALRTAQCGLALAPDSPGLHFLHAVVLQVLGRPEEAAAAYRRVIELEPGHPQAHANLGVVVKDLGRLSEAEQHLRRALELAPSYQGARASLSQILLAGGRYEEAWPYFESRWANFVDARGRPASQRPAVPLPQWRGERLDTATVVSGTRATSGNLLVIPEQGHGDSLQFVRYLPLAIERFAQVSYICPKNLSRICRVS